MVFSWKFWALAFVALWFVSGYILARIYRHDMERARYRRETGMAPTELDVILSEDEPHILLTTCVMPIVALIVVAGVLFYCVFRSLFTISKGPR